MGGNKDVNKLVESVYRPFSRLCKWSRTGGQNNKKKWCLAPKGINFFSFVLQIRYIFTDMKGVYCNINQISKLVFFSKAQFLFLFTLLYTCYQKLLQNVDIISDSDDAIAGMITQMKEAAEVL